MRHTVSTKFAIHSVLAFVACALLGSYVMSGTPDTTRTELRLPVVPVRLSRIVAKFPWAESIQLSPEIIGIAGSVMDNSDAMAVRQEVVLPGIIWQNPDGLVVVGISWLWPTLRGQDLEMQVMPPGQPPLRYTPVGVDERIGLLLAEPSPASVSPTLTGLEISLAEKPERNRLLICSLEANRLRLSAAAQRGDRLFPAGFPRPFPPLLLPVLTRAGVFEGFCQPLSMDNQDTDGLPLITRDEIRKRVDYIYKNRQNVTSGYLGVFIGERLGKPPGNVVYIRGIVPHSPADIAGLRPGDVIRSVGSKAVNTSRQLAYLLRQVPPNSSVRLDLDREDKRLRLDAIMGYPGAEASGRHIPSIDQLPLFREQAVGDFVESSHRASATRVPAHPTMGVFLMDAPPALLKTMGWDKPTGVLLTYVLPEFPAALSGLKAGDLMLEIQGAPVSKAIEVTRIVKSLQRGQKIQVRFFRNGETRATWIEVR